MDVTEEIQFIKAGKNIEENVYDHEERSVWLGQSPAVDVGGHQQQHDGAQKRQRRVRQTCDERRINIFNIDHTHVLQMTDIVI